MTKICNFFGHSRQALWKAKKRKLRTFIKEQQIVAQVKQFRSKQPRLGTRKLHKDLLELGFNVGRDQLFDILRKNNMLVKRKKRGPQTTYSKHWLHKYTNLIKGVELTASNQVFVADITYLRVQNRFAYLSLVTDAYSRKIVGWNLSDSLCTSGPLRALKMALKDVVHSEGLIHHSDRGIQYCSHEYTKVLKDNHVLISMTEENHCYENAIAERVNGILKNEFFLGETLPSFNISKELVRDSIHIYNYDRRHLSLNYHIPAEVHYAKQKW